MMKIMRAVVSLVLVLTFSVSSVSFAAEPDMSKLSPPSKFSSLTALQGSEFREAAQVQVGIRRALRGMTGIDLVSLRAIGSRAFIEQTVFTTTKISGTLEFDETAECQIHGDQVVIEDAAYLVKARVQDRTYYALVSMGPNGALDVSVAPQRLLDEALKSGVVTFTHESIKSADRAGIDAYVAHEYSEEGKQAIDEVIAPRMEAGEYLVQNVNPQWAPLYRNAEAELSSNMGLTAIYRSIGMVLRTLGVKPWNRTSIMKMLTGKTIVYLPVDRFEDLPATVVGGREGRVSIHASKTAIYFFVNRDVYDALKRGKIWTGAIAMSIHDGLIHEIGSLCGLPNRVHDDGVVANALDAAYNAYKASIRHYEPTTEFADLKPVDLDNLALRSDYASVTLEKTKSYFTRAMSLTLATVMSFFPACTKSVDTPAPAPRQSVTQTASADVNTAKVERAIAQLKQALDTGDLVTHKTIMESLITAGRLVVPQIIAELEKELRATKGTDDLSSGRWGYRASYIDILGAIGDERAIPALKKAMDDKVSYVRDSAANALAAMTNVPGQGASGVASPDVAKKVQHEIEMLQEDSMSSRLAAQENLLVIGKPAVPFLIKALKSSDEYTRAIVASILGDIGDPAAAAALRVALQDADELVRQAASEALEKLGDASYGSSEPESETGMLETMPVVKTEDLVKDATTQPVMQTLVLAQADNAGARQEPVVRLGEPSAFIAPDSDLGAIEKGKASISDIAKGWASGGSRSVPSLIETLLKGNGMTFTPRDWGGSVANEEHPGRALGSWAEFGNSVPVYERELAAMALGMIKDPAAVPALCAVVRNAEVPREVRQAAANALGEIGDTSAIPMLAASLSDGVCGVRYTAGRALDRLGWTPGSQAERIQHLFAKRDWAALAAAGQPATAVLIKGLEDDNLWVVEGSADAIGEIGDRSAADALSDVAERMRGRVKGDNVRQARFAVIGALGELKDQRGTAVLAAIAADKNESDDFRTNAVIALGSIGDSHAMKALADIAQEGGRPYPNMSSAGELAVVALVEKKDPRAVDPLIRQYARDADTLGGAKAIHALKKIGDARAYDTFMRALQDKDEGAVAAAAGGLGVLRDPRSGEVLIALLEKKNGYIVKKAAVVSLGMLKEVRAIDAIARYIDSMKGYDCPEAFDALANIGAPATSALGKLLGSPDAGTRRAAKEALARIGQPAAAGLATVMKGLNPDGKQGALQVLAGIGTVDKDAVFGQLHDPDAGVRLAALKTLRVIKGPGYIEACEQMAEDLDKTVAKEAVEVVAEAAEPRSIDCLVRNGAKGSFDMVSGALIKIGDQSLPAVNEALAEKDVASFYLHLAVVKHFLSETSIGALEKAARAFAEPLKEYDYPLESQKCLDVLALYNDKAVPSLIRLLDSSHHELRRMAMHHLGELKDARATERLLGFLKMTEDESESVEVRCAIEALGKIGDKRAVSRLTHLVKIKKEMDHHRFGIAFDAMMALARMGGLTKTDEAMKLITYGYSVSDQDLAELFGSIAGAAVPQLIKALDNDALRVRQRAAIALGSIGLPAASALPAMRAMVQSEKNPDMRDALMKAIAHIEGREDASQPSGSSEAEGEARMEMLETKPVVKTEDLVKDATTQPVMKTLILAQAEQTDESGALQDMPADVKGRLESALARGRSHKAVDVAQGIKDIEGIGDNAVPALREKLKDEDALIRFFAVRALGVIGREAESRRLLGMMEDDRRAIRYEAARSIASIAVRGRGPSLIDLLQDEKTRSDAAEALKWLADPRTVQPLLAILKNVGADPMLRMSAAAVLGEIRDKRAVEGLIEGVRDFFPEVRILSAVALGNIGDKLAVQPLIAALQDEERDVRTCAAKALGLLGDAKALKPLLGALRSERGPYDEDHLYAMTRIGGKEAVQLFVSELQDKKSTITARVLEGIRILRASEAVPVLLELLRSEGVVDYLRVFSALQAIGDKRAVLPIIDVLKATAKDEFGSPHNYAADALGVLGDARAVAPLIMTLQNKEETASVRCSAARSLGAIRDPQAVPALIEALKDTDEYVRESAEKALGAIRSKEAVPELVRLTKDDARDVRKYAVDALYAISGKEAIAPIAQALGDREDYVRDSAAEALGMIGGKEAISALIGSLRKNEYGLTDAAHAALVRIGSAALPDLNEAVSRKGSNLGLVKAVMDDIVMIDKIKSLVRSLGSADEAVWKSAVAGLSEIGKPVVPFLYDALGRSDEVSHARIVAFLATISNPREICRWHSQLLYEPTMRDEETLKEISTAARIASMKTIAEIGDAEDIDALNESAKKGGTREVRDAAIKALERLRAILQETATRPVSGSSEAEGEARTEVKESELSPAAASFESAMNKKIWSEIAQLSSETRFTVRENLVRIGSPAIPSLLVALRGDPDPDIRMMAASILGEIGDETVIDALRLAEKEPNSYVAEAATEALQELRSRRVMVEGQAAIDTTKGGVKSAREEHAGLTADADAVAERLWEYALDPATGPVVRQELDGVLALRQMPAADRKETIDALLNQAALLAAGIVGANQKQGEGMPDESAIRQLAARIQAEKIWVYIPNAYLIKNTSGEFRRTLKQVFGDQLVAYQDVADLGSLIEHPANSIVMTVDLDDRAVAELEKVKDAIHDVRFMNFEDMQDLRSMSNAEYQHYMAETLSILLVARTITREEAMDRASAGYRLLSGLLEDHLADAQETAAYITALVNTSVDPVMRLKYLIKAILKAMPVTEYKIMKPAVEVLWSA